jgi:hypothetical protein
MSDGSDEVDGVRRCFSCVQAIYLKSLDGQPPPPEAFLWPGNTYNPETDPGD